MPGDAARWRLYGNSVGTIWIEQVTTEEAFQVIVESLSRREGISLKSTLRDEEKFGNFLVAFARSEGYHSLVCDRGELVLCQDLHGAKDCVTIIPRLYDVTKEQLLDALGSL